MKRLVIVVLILSSLAWGRSSRRHVLDPITEVLRHRQQETRRPAALRVQPDQPVGALLPDAGQIAVVDDGDGVFVPAAGFNLDQKTLQFQPSGTNAAQYSYALAAASRFDAGVLTSASAVRLEDDDAVKVNLSFSFPFYGQRHDSLFIHSDGNVAFGAPEASSFPRDLDRLVTGPPRIAPLFVDLDPSQPDAAISVVSSATRFLITWNRVPLYDERPGPLIPRQTFQLSLFPDGRIEFSYNGVNVATLDGPVVLGIVPGGATRLEQVSLVDFSSTSAATFTNAIVEEFSSEPQFDFLALMQKFYRNHEDPYDFVVVFDGVTRDVGACAFALPIRNWVHGIGLRVSVLGVEEFDAAPLVGSAGRIQNFIYMGPLSRYPADPAQALPPGGICGRNTVLSILGQEAGHRFLAYPRFVDPATGQRSPELLGRDFQHWSFYLNTNASVAEGNQIEDKGQGVVPRFETKEIVQRYSPLDHYLMGLRAPEDVPTTFLVRQASIDFPRDHPPQSGLLFNGARLDITVPMIAAAEGRRAPDHTVSPKQFRFAFVLLLPAGAAPAQADVEKLDRIRTAWETFFATAVENRARADTRLVKQLELSVWPAAGLVQGRTVTATLTLGAPATSPVTVNLAASSGAISAPRSVTVPAGSRTAEFSITANSAGVAELTAQGPDDSYDTARAFLQVQANTAGLRLERLESPFFVGALILPALGIPLNGPTGANLGDPLIFRVRDQNFLPYPGLRLNASASGAGSVPGNLVTNGKGIVRLHWRLDTNPGTNTLNVSIEGQPDAAVRVEVVGVPHPARRRDPRPVPEP